MASNKLTTEFVYNDRDGAKLDARVAKLKEAVELETKIGKGLNPNIGNSPIADAAVKITDNFKKAKTELDKLKSSIDTTFQKPSISRYWEAEEKSIRTTTERITGLVDNAKAAINRPLTVPQAAAPIAVNFTDNYTAAFTDIDRRIAQTTNSFQKISQANLAKGNFDTIAQQAVVAEKELNKVANRLRQIKRESADPANAKFGKYYVDGIRQAEAELSKYEKRLSSIQNSPGGVGKNNLRLSSSQKTNLSYQINDVLTGLASGQNPAQIAAQQGGQIAQIFDPAQAKALVAAYAPLVAITAAGVAAIALTYKITGDIRKEAERRLKVEESITGAINSQRIAQRDAFRDLQKERIAADRASNVSQFLKTDDIEALKRRRDLILSLVTPNASNVSLVPAALPVVENGKVVAKSNESFLTLKKELLDIEARIKEAPIERNAQSQKLFEQGNEDFKKSQQNSTEANNRRLIELKKESEKLLSLRDELKNTLISNGTENNPFVKLLSDVEEVGRRAEKQFELVGESAVKAVVETSNAARKLNESRFGSDLQSLKFNQEARRLNAQPETYFADFQRRLERVERESSFISNTNQLSRQISETETALRFNPNNPKSLEEMQRRFIGDDASIRNALSDISGLRSISTNGTGAFGESAVAGEVLKVLPSLNELVAALSNPKLAGDARFLLNERSNALRSQRTGEQAKFRDFIENQKVSELGKRDAYEALSLLRNTNGLDRSFQLSQVLAITQELGNDLDPNLRRGRFEALKESAQIEANKEREAREYNARIENYLKNVVSALTSKGIVIEENSRGNTNVVVNSKDVEVDRSLGRSPTNFDTQETYDLGFAGGTNR